MLHETFIRTHRGLPAPHDGDHLADWAYRIANNVLTDHHRKHTLALLADDASIVAPPTDPRSIIFAGAATWLAAIIETLPALVAELRRPSVSNFAAETVAEHSHKQLFNRASGGNYPCAELDCDKS